MHGQRVSETDNHSVPAQPTDRNWTGRPGRYSILGKPLPTGCPGSTRLSSSCAPKLITITTDNYRLFCTLHLRIWQQQQQQQHDMRGDVAASGCLANATLRRNPNPRASCGGRNKAHQFGTIGRSRAASTPKHVVLIHGSAKGVFPSVDMMEKFEMGGPIEFFEFDG